MSKNILNNSLKITNQCLAELPDIDFESIKNGILGSDYQLSLVICSPLEIKKLNASYRQKNEPTDILSFPYSEKTGEIFICPEETAKAAVKFQRKYDNFFAYLFIHGCTHLKGYDHSDTMEQLEVKFRQKFGI